MATGPDHNGVAALDGRALQERVGYATLQKPYAEARIDPGDVLAHRAVGAIPEREEFRRPIHPLILPQQPVRE